MRNNIGMCALCKKRKVLTFEHIPPKAAFNSVPAKLVTGEKIMEDSERMPWDITGLRYSNQQQGMGKYSLCAECNNNTGTWYGNDYITIAQVIHHTLINDDLQKFNGLGIRKVYPLRFIKQVISMFCSINNFEDARIDELRTFVLEKDSVGINKSKYRVDMYITKSNYKKYAPLSVLVKRTTTGLESMALSEITAYPLGFVLYFDPSTTWKYDGINITNFGDCGFNDLADIEIPLCIKDANDILPTFYRSRGEVEKCIEYNKKN